MEVTFGCKEDKSTFFKWATALSLITIFYNFIEGVISVIFGVEGGTVTLFGFGIDSFVEVLSGIGIWHMIRRMKENSAENHDKFEKMALQITGTAFYILTVGLIITSFVNLYKGYKPQSTLWGIVVGIVSILAMWALSHYKINVGERFNSQAMLADAACTKTCLYLSVILLIASVCYELTGIGMVDSLGAIGIAFFAFKEGREAFEKAEGRECCCGKECR
ncbi:MAG TPA: cation transporter [Dissulfurispiraceae bacterium]|nr:cation transporter [Dissulfurispiraceae bacterium]